MPPAVLSKPNGGTPGGVPKAGAAPRRSTPSTPTTPTLAVDPKRRQTLGVTPSLAARQRTISTPSAVLKRSSTLPSKPGGSGLGLPQRHSASGGSGDLVQTAFAVPLPTTPSRPPAPAPPSIASRKTPLIKTPQRQTNNSTTSTSATSTIRTATSPNASILLSPQPPSAPRPRKLSNGYGGAGANGHPWPAQPDWGDDGATESRTVAGLSTLESGWELETEVDEAGEVDEEIQAALTQISRHHSTKILSYKRLLESSQHASAAQLYALQAEVAELRRTLEHERSAREGVERRARRAERWGDAPDGGTAPGRHVGGGGNFAEMLKYGFDEIEVRRAVRSLRQDERLRLMHVILEACLPHDISATIRMLQKYAASAFDMLGTLPAPLATRILSFLEVRETLAVSLVSRKWLEATKEPELWRHYVLRLTAMDPVPVTPPEDESGWEPLYRALHFRERNWAMGLPQSIKFLQGHTNFVTSMQLKGGVLVTGSYDETLRIWDLTNGGECKTVLRAKAISCLDYLPARHTLAAGYHDVGRVVVYSTLTNQPLQVLQGHNRGIRAVAVNDDFLVSAGQDKALVAWNWRTGERIVRFGQQTNLCIGVQLIDADKFVAVTVDSIIRCFSISKREMTAQYKLSSLSPELTGLGGTPETMLTWFGAEKLSLTCATKNVLIHLEWEEGEEVVLDAPPPRANAAPRASLPSTTSVRSRLSASRGPGGPPSAASSTRRASGPAAITAMMTSKTPTPSPPPRRTRLAPKLTSPPRIVALTRTQDMAVGATDVRKQRVVMGTRFSTRVGADRRLFVSMPNSTEPITGIWAALSPSPEDVGVDARDSLATPARGPMSICVDHQQAVVGCSDGTVYVLSFVGDNYRPPRAARTDEEAELENDENVAPAAL